MGPEEILVVTGLPRSGTSMLMRMLAAGGVPLLVDDARAADDHNPHGYFEFTPVKRLKQDAAWVPRARGRAVKVISYLLPFLPAGETYRVIFVERDLREVAASQARMLGKEEAGPSDTWLPLLERQNALAQAWIARAGAPLLTVRFEALHGAPGVQAARLGEFIGGGADVAAMAAAVDATLYRSKQQALPGREMT